MKRTSGRVFAFGAAVLLSSILFIDVCGLVFGCGCRSLWAGAAAACNIQKASGPHCPWCAHPLAAGAVVFLAILAVQARILLGPGRAGTALRFALALLSFPVTAGVIGAIQGFLWDSWRP
jgi:hypothetical protein